MSERTPLNTDATVEGGKIAAVGRELLSKFIVGGGAGAENPYYTKFGQLYLRYDTINVQVDQDGILRVALSWRGEVVWIFSQRYIKGAVASIRGPEGELAVVLPKENG